MTLEEPIDIRHLEAEGRRIPVHFFRNRDGSVHGRFMLCEGDTPIVDGPTPDAVLGILRDVLEGLLLARSLRSGA